MMISFAIYHRGNLHRPQHPWRPTKVSRPGFWSRGSLSHHIMLVEESFTSYLDLFSYMIDYIEPQFVQLQLISM